MKKVTAFVGTARKKRTYYAVHKFLSSLDSLGDLEYEIIALILRRTRALFSTLPRQCPPL